ncbi:GFA family protein [Dyella sp. C11]|uniref:GFA family protein n=1 Tax=Dyella sp. C11 TaxID=2126991 RepID=UPI0013003E94|nr:GFA family protein [Dyella sp. C11]
MTIVNQRSVCACGASGTHVHGVLLARFFCHCTICQSLYKRPWADVMVFRPGAITVSDPNRLAFRRYRSLPALNRGVCSACGSPVVALTPGPSASGLGFMPAGTFENPGELPPPTHHIFYDRRVADVDDALPKIHGYWRSELAVGSLVVRGLLAARKLS